MSLCGRLASACRDVTQIAHRRDGGLETSLETELRNARVDRRGRIDISASSIEVSLDRSRIAGIAIAVPSFRLFVLARIQLGQAFSVQAKASTLVTTGLYSRIRNPIYVFGALMFVGVIVWTGRALRCCLSLSF